MRACAAVVGLLPPVWEEGQLLVDGGYLNNMPVDIMRVGEAAKLPAEQQPCLYIYGRTAGQVSWRPRHTATTTAGSRERDATPLVAELAKHAFMVCWSLTFGA